MTVRPTSFEKCEEAGGDAAVENIPFIDSEVKTTFVSREVSKSDRPELGNARVVVSRYNHSSITQFRSVTF